MDRRKFLTRLGIGTAGVAAVTAPGVAYVAGLDRGEKNLTGDFKASVTAGQRRGKANVWWSVDTTDRVLALTFDDGPTKQFTPAVLDILARYRVPATFFVIGANVDRRPDMVRRMADEGHLVANHTYDHFSAAIQARDDTRATVERDADAIATLLGERPRWFRPVRGHVTGALLDAAAEMGHDLALWSVSRDPGIGTADDDVDGVRDNYVTNVHEGAVVIFHDGIGRSAFELSGPDEQLTLQRRTEITALPDVIETYLAEGYQFLTVTDLIDRHGGSRNNRGDDRQD